MSQRFLRPCGKGISIGLSAFALLACGGSNGPSQSPPTEPATKPQALSPSPNAGPELGEWGIELGDRDLSVKPGDDFFEYVNGAWLDRFDIPAEFSNYGSFTVLFERSEKRVRSLIEDAARTAASEGSISQKIGDFYSSYVDVEAINAKGLSPIAPQLAAYSALETHQDTALAMANVPFQANSPVGLYVDVDNKKPDQYRVYLTQSGLGMPNRDFYIKPEFEDKRTAYKQFLNDLLEIAEPGAARSRADAVYALEETLAQYHWSPAKRRQADLTYNLYTLEEMEVYAPGLPWRQMFKTMGVGSQTTFILRENDAIQKSAALFAQTPVSVWKDYLTIHALAENAAVLPTNVDDVAFAFHGKALSGVLKQRARWKRGVAAVNSAMGEAVGQIYVERHFPPSSKTQMEHLVGNLQAAFAKRLNDLNWMADRTKAEARAKLDAFTTKIGYPEKWTDYSSLTIIPGDAFGNLSRTRTFAYEKMINRLGKPVDKTEWFMTPQTVNAYYSRNRNEIVFPAGILQAPFFDPAADPAVNYGGIGAVIGHEIGHGFDDQGRTADGSGLQRDWWSKA
ncbi:MAG: M13 family metallopeptidase, partial [Pseudomonadota bacterium]